ncbi:MAG: DEAD/DEAH box helicase [Peptococcaceae bacterium]|jgi:ATP-dependent DNA helicase DinG|nr:DEAD/DEAH box helicase [Peptococcaceae bacterium]
MREGSSQKTMVAVEVKISGQDERRAEVAAVEAWRIEEGKEALACTWVIRPLQFVSDQVWQGLGISQEARQKAVSLEECYQDILRFFEGAVLVGPEIAAKAAFLGRRLGVEIHNECWDVLELARIFFPRIQETKLKSLAARLAAAPGAEEKEERPELEPPENNAGLSWRLLRACWHKGLRFDLSFYQEAEPLTVGWQGKGFFDALRREISRKFPDRPIRVDLGLAWPEEGLFQKKEGKKAVPPERQWVEDCFAPRGLLEQCIDGFENRPGQRSMAKEVLDGLTQARHCVLEAGTGVGKSLAYLLPSVWWAQKTGGKVVVATHTIPLQEQIVAKDLRVIEAALPFSFKTALVKGKSNYLCLKEWLSYLRQAREESVGERIAVLSVLVWLRETLAGDFQELPYGLGYKELQAKIHADVEACNAAKCAQAELCFLWRARRQANQADLLIVNHSLLFADIKTGGMILPEYDYLVIDEAHHLFDTAVAQLGCYLSQDRVIRVLERLVRAKGGAFYTQVSQKLGRLAAIAPQCSWARFRDCLAALPEAVDLAKNQATELFLLLESIVGKQGSRRIRESDQNASWWEGLNVQLDNLSGRIAEIDRALEKLIEFIAEEHDEEIQDLLYEMSGLRAQLAMISEGFPYFLAVDHPQRVSWLEKQGRRVVWRSCPIEVSETLRECLFNRLHSVILTSATLTVADSFNHFCQEIGLPPDIRCVQVESPFCYEEQLKLFVVRSLLDAGQSMSGQGAVLADFLARVVRIWQGRTLALFTSHRLLQEVYQALESKLEDTALLGQGINGGRSAILDEFRQNSNTLILGTNSFWEGIDLPGDILKCVILVKLPFWAPGIPLIEARSEWLARQNQDPFNEYLLPQAVLRFKQGFGRLIRTKTDQGCIIVLDDRIVQKSYGKIFLRSLPVRELQAAATEDILAQITRLEKAENRESL